MTEEINTMAWLAVSGNVAGSVSSGVSRLQGAAGAAVAAAVTAYNDADKAAANNVGQQMQNP